jgi:ketosteroid isomerase-like protein
MGQAGWIPLDATANETDFVDSGHVRIGVHESAATAANPVEFEILDHRIGSGEVPPASTGDYEPYLGEYTQAETRRTMTVLVSDGALAVDIPGQIVLALNEPDEEGRRYAKLSPRVFVTFARQEDGRFDEMQIHEIVRMQRTATPEEIDADVPERFHPYLGTYLLAQLNAEFTVIYRDESLAVEDPLAKRTVGLQPPDAEGRWVDEFGKNAISFEREEDGVFMTMVIDSASTFRRGDAVAAEAEAVVDESPEVQAVKAALRDLHQAGADADAERLFGCFDPDAIIFGTDKSERFTLEEYRRFVEPYLAQGHGWTSVPTEQNVYVSEDGNFAWFDERLDKPGFQELRGTGVLRKIDGSWKVLQMNMAFTVPNELAGSLAEMVRELDQGK